MAKFGKLGGLVALLGGAALLPMACAGDTRDFLPEDEGDGSSGEGGQGGEATGGTANLGGNSSGGSDGSGGDASPDGGSPGVGGTSTCTDTLPGGEECGGTCDPCPDGLACEEPEDCSGEQCLSNGECCTLTDEAELCAGLCGTVTDCEQDVECGDCTGEATCGSSNTCGCPERPCAIASSSYGDVNQQYVRGLAVDGAGNAWVVGEFRGTMTFGTHVLTSQGTTADDVFLVKFDVAGNPIWADSFGDTSDQSAAGVAVDGAGNVVIVGESSGTVNFGGADLLADSDMYIAKFSPSGVHQFSDFYGPDNVTPAAVTCDLATGEIIVTGNFWGSLDFGPLSAMAVAGTNGYEDMFAVRFSAAGVPQYSKRFGADWGEYGESVAVQGSYAYFSGTFKDVLDFGSPNPTPLTSTGWSDLFVAKLGKSSFSHVWSKRFGDDGASGYAVDTTQLVVDPPTGDVVVGGNFTGTLEFTPPLVTTDYELFLAKLDGDNGAPVWGVQVPNAEMQAMTRGPDGHVYLTGSVTGDADFGGGIRTYSGTRDVYIAKFNFAGDHVYSRVFSSPTGNQYGYGIGATASGEAWIASQFDGQLELGTGPLQSQGGNDIAVGKYAP